MLTPACSLARSRQTNKSDDGRKKLFRRQLIPLRRRSVWFIFLAHGELILRIIFPYSFSLPSFVLLSTKLSSPSFCAFYFTSRYVAILRTNILIVSPSANLFLRPALFPKFTVCIFFHFLQTNYKSSKFISFISFFYKFNTHKHFFFHVHQSFQFSNSRHHKTSHLSCFFHYVFNFSSESSSWSCFPHDAAMCLFTNHRRTAFILFSIVCHCSTYSFILCSKSC